MKYSVSVNKNSFQHFNNNVDFCVGTGRMGLALTKEYYDQLKTVQNEIGFRFIRGHGLFCDDMGIYQVYRDTAGLKKPDEFQNFREYMDYVEKNAPCITEYNFTYLDRVMDSYLELNIRPFLELGFMPKELASGDNTIFYWKGHTTPPKDYEKWCGLVKATLEHLMKRYGRDEVITWPVEVWNEPNLPGFWENADIEAYYKLYELTSKAVKETDPSFKVGGPAICGGADEKWMKGFLTYCRDHQLPLDFITRHHYTTEFPENKGHYGYPKLTPLDETLDTLRECRKITDSFSEYKNLPFYITEFNTSYIPNCPLHDTNLNAAYIARTLAEIGDYVTGYSYWTFGDVFEERGIPFTPFHGGFGMLAEDSIPKPVFWTFKFFRDLKENTDEASCLYRDRNLVLLKTKNGGFKGIIWNLTNETEQDEITAEITLSSLPAENKNKRWCLITKTVDEKCCNPLKIWHDYGAPSRPDKNLMNLIKASAKPLIESDAILLNEEGSFSVTAGKNGVVYFELQPAPLETDNGYDYAYQYNVPYVSPDK